MGFLILLYYPLIKYGLAQVNGQLYIIWNTVPVEEVLNDSSTSEEMKMKLRLIEEVRTYLEDSLGLNQTENYTTYYDQKDQPILWIVTASPEFEIKAYEWDFPILGRFPYKGFFDLASAEKEEKKMQKAGLDTEIDEVNAWSTLGWLKDPILSSMLKRSPARLAELIIHESTHATLYVKDGADFNENLASFIGVKGAEKFITEAYGTNSEQLLNYKLARKRNKIYKSYMTIAIERLKEKYKHMGPELSIKEKRNLKKRWVNELKMGLLETNYFDDKIEGKMKLEKFQLNNATLSGFSTYSSLQSEMETMYEGKYHRDLKKMIQDFKKKYRSL